MTTERCKPKGEAPLCACGCGNSTAWNESHNRWSAFVNGHQNNGRPSKLRKDIGEAPLCACGCGERVKTYRYSKGWASYLQNHAPRLPHTPESIKKMRLIALSRNVSQENNPAWRGGVAEENYKNHPGRQQKHKWNRLREIVRQRDGGKCVLCGIETDLDTHHIDGDVSHNVVENLVTLCHRCHMRTEFSTEKDQLAAQISQHMHRVSETI